MTTGRESDKFMLRLPDGMRDRIKAAADANNRSMNSEIVATLEDKYPAPKASPLSERAMDLFGQITTAQPHQIEGLIQELNQELEKATPKMVASFAGGRLVFTLPEMRMPSASRAPGTPSPESLARLQTAMAKAPAPIDGDKADRQSIGALIDRMAGSAPSDPEDKSGAAKRKG